MIIVISISQWKTIDFFFQDAILSCNKKPIRKFPSVYHDESADLWDHLETLQIEIWQRSWNGESGLNKRLWLYTLAQASSFYLYGMWCVAVSRLGGSILSCVGSSLGSSVFCGFLQLPPALLNWPLGVKLCVCSSPRVYSYRIHSTPNLFLTIENIWKPNLNHFMKRCNFTIQG